MNRVLHTIATQPVSFLEMDPHLGEAHFFCDLFSGRVLCKFRFL